MVLVTGPTGSGKTTTLYSALSELNKSTDNISTAEDPVEFNLAGINQVQMHEDIGLNFAAALRAFLRQDPDIIMVGEIRDFETAEIAVKAALTGHLVLSTLHTNDAPSTISRLLNMGVEPFLVTASVNLILAQRLARKICADCKSRRWTSRRARCSTIQASSRGQIGELQVFKRAGLQDCCNDRLQGPHRALRGHGVQRRAQGARASTARRPPRSRRRRSGSACRRCAWRASTRCIEGMTTPRRGRCASRPPEADSSEPHSATQWPTCTSS